AQGLTETAQDALDALEPIGRIVPLPLLDQRAEVRALDVLHGDPGVVDVLARIEDAHDARMAQLLERLELALEAPRLVGRRFARVQNFQCDASLALGVR